MKIPILILILISGCGLKRIDTKPDKMVQQATASVYDIVMKSIDGEEIKFDQYKGQKLLIVNTASECGFTPQYEDLQELNEKYGDKITILGFPSNNFGGQEPGTNEEISKFCTNNYNISFQMFEKIDVVGNNKNPLYKWLTDQSLNGWNSSEPSWNFCKYLVSEEGELMKFYGSAIKPLSDEILAQIR